MSEQMITSVNNSAVKQIRALRQRGERAGHGLCFVEGIRIVAEAVQTGAPLDCLVIAPELLTSSFAQELIGSERLAAVRRLVVSAKVFASLSGKEGPQGLAAVVRQRWEQLEQIRMAAGDLWVALDAPQDPGNLGSIMRTADAVGAAGIMLIGHAADPYDAGAIRASMGSVFSMRLVQTDISAFLLWRAEQAVNVVGTAGAGSCDYRRADYHRPLVVLSGSERLGLPPPLLQACDQLVRIPMAGRCDSLNLAVATSIVLYAAQDSR